MEPINPEVESLLTRKEIKKRGWTKEQMRYFTRKTHTRTESNEPAWQESYIENVEKSISFKNFTTLEDFFQRTKIVEKGLKNQNEAGIERIKGLSLKFEQHDCLLKNKDSYDNLKPIFHLVKKDFTPDDNGSYSLFTDGCFKTIGRNAFACCAGWILDNNTNEIVVEFTKTVELSDKLNNGMPEFELRGIFEGVNVVKQLGLKNVQCFTDSAGEAKTILSALNNIGDTRVTRNIELYEPIIETLKNGNSTIGWVPREYNHHADELTKIPLNAWINHYNKIYLEHDYMKEVGYVVNRDKEIYFHQNNVECKESNEANSRWKLTSLKPERDDKNKTIYIVLYDTETKTIQILDEKDKKHYQEFNIDDSVSEDIIRFKKSKPDSSYIRNLSALSDKIKDFPEIDISVPHGVLAVMKKLTPIPPSLQEEYFEFHKFCTDLSGQINVTTLDSKMMKEITKVFEETFAKKEKKMKI
jgi:ribonuclease HI